MYLIVRFRTNPDNGTEENDYYGPFPTKERAVKYAESIEHDPWDVRPLIVPNCVQVKLVY